MIVTLKAADLSLISLPLVWPLQKVFSKKSILKIQNKILFCIFKIKYYFENSILHITAFVTRYTTHYPAFW